MEEPIPASDKGSSPYHYWTYESRIYFLGEDGKTDYDNYYVIRRKSGASRPDLRKQAAEIAQKLGKKVARLTQGHIIEDVDIPLENGDELKPVTPP